MSEEIKPSPPSDQETNNDVTTPALLFMTGAQAVGFVVFGAAMWHFSDRALEDFITFSVREVAIGLAIAGALIALGIFLTRTFPKFAERLARSQAKNFPFLADKLPMTAIVLISICAGVGEEALFRAGLQTLLSDYMPYLFALILASVVFALIHFAQPVVSLLIFIIGAVFGLIYWWTGSLLAVMIGHTVYDIYALWFLQEELHRLGVFQSDEAEQTPD